MRQAEEIAVWTTLKEKYSGVPADLFNSGPDVQIDLSAACTVIGGRNGSGKTRLLKSIAEHLGDRGFFVDLHHLCEQALMVLRDLEDAQTLLDEVGPFGPAEKRLADVKRIVGRDYDEVQWYSLDLTPSDPSAAERFRWRGDSSLMPYFRVNYGTATYDSTDMGLGEFASHFLFWILEQVRDQKNLILLLDEPDAYLPPVGVSALLQRLLRICREREWRIVLTSHSEELIRTAVEHDAFVRLRLDNHGAIKAMHSLHDRSVVKGLLQRSPLERVIFVEDESAHHLAAALLRIADAEVASQTDILWTKGEGDLKKLQKHLPRPPRPSIRFAVVPDGDQRLTTPTSEDNSRWPFVFLPGSGSPDELFKSLGRDTTGLAQCLGVDSAELELVLESIASLDSHDWVNGLGAAFGREHTLRSLAEMWVRGNPDEAQAFLRELQDRG